MACGETLRDYGKCQAFCVYPSCKQKRMQCRKWRTPDDHVPSVDSRSQPSNRHRLPFPLSRYGYLWLCRTNKLCTLPTLSTRPPRPHSPKHYTNRVQDLGFPRVKLLKQRDKAITFPGATATFGCYLKSSVSYFWHWSSVQGQSGPHPAALFSL